MTFGKKFGILIAMKRLLMLLGFVLGNLSILFVALLGLTIYTTKSSTAADFSIPATVEIVQDNYSIYGALPSSTDKVSGQIIASDARVKLVEQYFKRYNSPMEGQGKAIVAAADKYRLPFNLLPAIAQCEGNLGKVMPYNSFNPFGFGIYGDRMTKFDSWAQAFETVSKTIRKDYFDLGLTNPDLMMPKYTPPSKGSWAHCVNQFMEELR